MTASKANYYEFTGTVPGQPDGTTGEIAFFMSDDLGNSSQSVNFPMSWSKDNPILSEGFESNFPPQAGLFKLLEPDLSSLKTLTR
jgi:hypothetical protein